MAENNKQLQEAKKLLEEINILRGKLNQTPLKMTDSEAVQNVQSLRNELKGVRNSFAEVDESELVSMIKLELSLLNLKTNPVLYRE